MDSCSVGEIDSSVSGGQGGERGGVECLGILGCCCLVVGGCVEVVSLFFEIFCFF